MVNFEILLDIESYLKPKIWYYRPYDFDSKPKFFCTLKETILDARQNIKFREYDNEPEEIPVYIGKIDNKEICIDGIFNWKWRDGSELNTPSKWEN